MTERPGFRLVWSGPGNPAAAALLDTEALHAHYATPESWLRANLATTLDGSVTGADGLSGSINNAADHAVFTLLREWSEAIVVGAGTARAEGYRTAQRPLVLVSQRGYLPEGLTEPERGLVVLVAPRAAPGLARSVEQLGGDYVIPLGDDRVDLRRLRPAVAERGWRRLLCEGGPTLLHGLVTAGVVDELTATVVPRLAAGHGPRLLQGDGLEQDLELTSLLAADDGTLFGRWRLVR